MFGKSLYNLRKGAGLQGNQSSDERAGNFTAPPRLWRGKGGCRLNNSPMAKDGIHCAIVMELLLNPRMVGGPVGAWRPSMLVNTRQSGTLLREHGSPASFPCTSPHASLPSGCSSSISVTKRM